MVDGDDDDRVQQLRDMQRFMKWRNVDMAEIAGVSQQAVGKWLKRGGGKIGGKSFAALVRAATVQGFAARPGHGAEQLPEYILKGDDEVDKKTVQQIFDALPRHKRAQWIEFGNMLVERYAPPGPANPIAKPGKVKAPAKVKPDLKHSQ